MTAVSLTPAATIRVPDEHRRRLRVVAAALAAGLDEQGRGFRLVRRVDHSGISGTGVVAEGVELPDGTVLMWWVVPGKPSTCTPYTSFADIARIHGHNGDAVVQWQEG